MNGKTSPCKDACTSLPGYVQNKLVTFYKGKLYYIKEVISISNSIEMGVINYNDKDIVGVLNYKNGSFAPTAWNRN